MDMYGILHYDWLLSNNAINKKVTIMLISMKLPYNWSGEMRGRDSLMDEFVVDGEQC